MPHPDYPHPDPHGHSPGLWVSPPGDPEQFGTSPNRAFFVRVSTTTPGLIRCWWTELPHNPPLHPHAKNVDTPATRALTGDHPLLTLSAHGVPENPHWHNLARHPQLARAISEAIARTRTT